MVSDNFDAGVPSPFWGFATNSTGPTAAVTGGRLEVSVPAGSTSGTSSIVGGLWSRCAVSGDFDMQADYQLLGANPGAGLFELFAWQFGGSVMGGVARDFQVINGSNSYAVFQSFGAAPQRVSTTDTTGRIRLQRIGATAREYYDSGGQWVQIGEVSLLNRGRTGWNDRCGKRHHANHVECVRQLLPASHRHQLPAAE